MIASYWSKIYNFEIIDKTRSKNRIFNTFIKILYEIGLKNRGLTLLQVMGVKCSTLI